MNIFMRETCCSCLLLTLHVRRSATSGSRLAATSPSGGAQSAQHIPTLRRLISHVSACPPPLLYIAVAARCARPLARCLRPLLLLLRQLRPAMAFTVIAVDVSTAAATGAVAAAVVAAAAAAAATIVTLSSPRSRFRPPASAPLVALSLPPRRRARRPFRRCPSSRAVARHPYRRLARRSSSSPRSYRCSSCRRSPRHRLRCHRPRYCVVAALAGAPSVRPPRSSCAHASTQLRVFGCCCCCCC